MSYCKKSTKTKISDTSPITYRRPLSRPSAYWYDSLSLPSLIQPWVHFSHFCSHAHWFATYPPAQSHGNLLHQPSSGFQHHFFSLLHDSGVLYDTGSSITDKRIGLRSPLVLFAFTRDTRALIVARTKEYSESEMAILILHEFRKRRDFINPESF